MWCTKFFSVLESSFSMILIIVALNRVCFNVSLNTIFSSTLKNLLFEYYFKEREKGKQQSRDHEETKRQIEEDADEEIVKLMQTHEQALIACKEENSNLKNKSTTYQRKVRLK